MRWKGLWGKVQPDVKMLKVSDGVGQALTQDEEARLLEECTKSRSRSLYPVVVLALSTTMRYSEIRLLTWKQVDFFGNRIRVGKSKTEYGEGRATAMNDRCLQVVTIWSEAFRKREPEHYVFPTEKYGAAGDDFKPCVYLFN
jgi:integrase